jgi:hypothetical protein
MLLLGRRCDGESGDVSTSNGDSSDFFEDADRSLDGLRKGPNRLFHEDELAEADAIAVVAAMGKSTEKWHRWGQACAAFI